MTNWASSLLAAVIFAAPLTTLAQSAATLRALLIEYRCPVVDRLERIYEAGDPASQRDRFLAVTLSGHPHGYVQCMFVERRTRILCEAASGYWYDKPGTLRTFRQPAEAIVALGRLGFDTDDSQGNFSIDFAVADPPDLNGIADFILKALHDGYGARAEFASNSTRRLRLAPHPNAFR